MAIRNYQTIWRKGLSLFGGGCLLLSVAIYVARTEHPPGAQLVDAQLTSAQLVMENVNRQIMQAMRDSGIVTDSLQIPEQTLDNLSRGGQMLERTENNLSPEGQIAEHDSSDNFGDLYFTEHPSNPR